MKKTKLSKRKRILKKQSTPAHKDSKRISGSIYNFNSVHTTKAKALKRKHQEKNKFSGGAGTKTKVFMYKSSKPKRSPRGNTQKIGRYALYVSRTWRG